MPLADVLAPALAFSSPVSPDAQGLAGSAARRAEVLSRGFVVFSFSFSLEISAAVAPVFVAGSKCLGQVSILTEEAPRPSRDAVFQKRS